jgi:hypothetical protein
VIRIALLSLAILGLAAGPADAATKHPHHKKRKHHAARTVAAKRPAAESVAPATPAAATAPAPAVATPAVTSVISIGGYVFYNLSYADAVAAYQAAVAAAPVGYTPPPVTSVSATITVGN